MIRRKALWSILWLLPLGLFFLINQGCTSNMVQEKEYTSGGKVSYKSTTEDQKMVYELRRVFDKTTIEGVGIIENANEGLARRAATQLAVADVASQIQTLVRTDTVIYNNKDIRDVVDNRVRSLVSGYKVDYAGYDPGTKKYRVRVSVSGENIRREIEKRIVP